MDSATQTRLLLAAASAQLKSDDPARHKCFLSYHAQDAAEVVTFLEDFGHVFIPRVIGVSDEDDFIDSANTDYVMDSIREEYLTDSSVTIVLLGRCTWARRYVDWEVYSSLRNDKKNRRNGLMAITLPSASTYPARQLPARVADNLDGDDGYARWWKYPNSAERLADFIELAFLERITRAKLIDNSRPRRMRNAPCG
ncbi:MAG TPA: TIR domain-containing protein [Solirubrobacterales bacterium]|nr:TIR domain-containing protein [Solirubrobacterales bacterium]